MIGSDGFFLQNHQIQSANTPRCDREHVSLKRKKKNKDEFDMTGSCES